MKIFRTIIVILLLLIFFLVAGFGLYGFLYYREKVDKDPLEPKIEKIMKDYTYVKKEDLPKDYLNAVVAVEDHRFYDHGAVDFIGILRAIFVNLKNQELQEGGSTITQQVAKNLYFMDDSSQVFRRKLAEVFVSIDLQNKYDKEQILEIYANTINFGNGFYGINEACQGYLHKKPSEMTLAEATMMAGIPNAPSVYAPTVNKDLCKQRQKKVIQSMVENKYITQEEADKIDQSFIDSIE